MAFSKQGLADYAASAGADLTGKLNLFAKLNSSGEIVLAAAATDAVIGTIIEEAEAGKPATVQCDCISKVVCGGTITVGDRLTSDSAGKAVATSSAGNLVHGIALASGVANEVIPMLWARGHVAAS